MPAVAADSLRPALSNSAHSSFDGHPRKSHDKALTASGVFTYTNGTDVDTGLTDHRIDQYRTLLNASHSSLTNGLPNGSLKRTGSRTGSTPSLVTREDRSQLAEAPSKLSNVENVSEDRATSPSRSRAQTSPNDLKVNIPMLKTEQHQDSTTADTAGTEPLSPSSTRHAPPQRLSNTALPPKKKDSNEFPQLTHRHTALGVPKSSTGRTSRDFSFTGGPSEEVLHASGRFSPTHDTHQPRHRRASLSLIRRSTRAHSDAHIDEIPPDEEAAHWTEVVRQQRASKRARRRDDDDDRVIVGKKVEEGHVNWVTAYNMLTGIRFTVSRTNAKMDRELVEADFDAKHNFSFDVTGNELTPSAKYDFKFKDYSPWVFRHLRADFGLDPADYLMSLTSKYILSELGSPGKSGSFFYFSRDYKYIIKTIHHAEHKLLRRILREYYHHVKDNPNTLMSQIYGLHRVKIPYGRKIHFLVMNNLFPPHRDIHQTFDLKGSTVGRDFKEEELAGNPRATLKDLNWLRRDYHLEFDHQIKQLFIEQLQRDVALLQKLHLMDYSLLVGIHDLNKGNEENLREQNLRVFQPGGRRGDGGEEEQPSMLMRTPSRLENLRRTKELRLTLKKERPMPFGLVSTQMPDEMESGDVRKGRVFYKDDGGIRATHEDGHAGELVYYLGVIDCLTHYGFVKRLEHFWKGLSANRSQISPVPPQQYGDRFLNFVTGITMTKEEADRRRERGDSALSEVAPIGVAVSQRTSINTGPVSAGAGNASSSLDVDRTNEKLAGRSPPGSPMAVEHTMAKAQKQVEKETGKEGRRRSEEEKPQRTLLTAEDAKSNTLLPMVSEETGEGGSRNGSATGSARSRSHSRSRAPSQQPNHVDQQDFAAATSSSAAAPTQPNHVNGKSPQHAAQDSYYKKATTDNDGGIRMVSRTDSDGHPETDLFGHEKVSVQMPGPEHPMGYDPSWEHRPSQQGKGVPGFAGGVNGAADDENEEEVDEKADYQGGNDGSNGGSDGGPVQKRRSKPPRINSDIIPPFSPLDASIPGVVSDDKAYFERDGGDPEKRPDARW
ncbi:Phosphatidylinositol 4-phosphate 5-kinase its3 [Cyphellophora attinorum]|uniref:1-phosphatidylinositol-4-phosphate 5-kinase n=1 Tax=Cyphellophora attinorum TaxID=1664694 RepID=A0A0N1P1I4_9EURO|nr:Phosphatidylinositol 4-phosphate 5-kinase its3 [Phialophora attinorum]KPI44944.1 Phosphatidylinositol 4-phosphate 5-kinase its3 [Phialophora attinorum]